LYNSCERGSISAKNDASLQDDLAEFPFLQYPREDKQSLHHAQQPDCRHVQRIYQFGRCICGENQKEYEDFLRVYQIV